MCNTRWRQKQAYFFLPIPPSWPRFSHSWPFLLLSLVKLREMCLQFFKEKVLCLRCSSDYVILCCWGHRYFCCDKCQIKGSLLLLQEFLFILLYWYFIYSHGWAIQRQTARIINAGQPYPWSAITLKPLRLTLITEQSVLDVDVLDAEEMDKRRIWVWIWSNCDGWTASGQNSKSSYSVVVGQKKENWWKSDKNKMIGNQSNAASVGCAGQVRTHLQPYVTYWHIIATSCPPLDRIHFDCKMA